MNRRNNEGEMKKTIVWIIGIFITASLICMANRYQITGAGERCAYEVDKFTGKTWYLVANRKIPCAVSEENKPPISANSQLQK